ncbi:MAG: peptidylprolyl isomerase [Thioalkalivibrio sp.]
MHRFFMPLVLLTATTLSGALMADEQTKVAIETNHGRIVLQLDAAAAPQTVANFLRYVDEGFYDNTIFHRVIPGFMVQGGGFDPDMRQKPVHEPIPNEADNSLKNKTGTIAMARTNDPHSATAQFFINVSDNGFLDHSSKTPQGWGYAVFGSVAEGMSVVKEIEGVKTGRVGMHQDVPLEPVIMKSVTRVE